MICHRNVAVTFGTELSRLQTPTAWDLFGIGHRGSRRHCVSEFTPGSEGSRVRAAACLRRSTAP